jgi:LAS superfamily LD-carboxypeptidase LdcB
MGAAYKQRTGSKIAVSSTFRSQEEQTVLYEAWRAAGGNLQTKPVVDTPRGRIFTPAKTVGSHAGLAMDSGQMQVVVNTLGAAAISELGLKWGGTFSTPDVVHIQLAASPRPAAETVVRPPLNLP